MAAREGFAEKNYQVQYHDVQKDRALLEEMLALTKGRRSVPVILEGGKVTIGYGGT
jgi:glutaredoxin 3